MTDLENFEIDLKEEEEDTFLIIREGSTGQVVVRLEASIDPFFGGRAQNMQFSEDACTAVFAGHHWQHVQTSGRNRARECLLCEKRQKKIDRWENID